MESANLSSSMGTAMSESISAASSILGGPKALASAVTRASDVVEAHGSSSWLGLFARCILWILQLTSLVLYFTIKLATISIPSLLFTLFSTSLTFTMNATTL